MNSILISSLLDLKPVVSVWPPGSRIYLGESVVLWCTVASNLTSEWRYQWHRDKPAANTSIPRHMVSNDSYSITAVTWEDEDSYRCTAKNSTVELRSQPVVLSVAEFTPDSTLALTSNTTQMFRGENFTLLCHISNSSDWKLKHFPLDHTESTTVSQTDQCVPLEGADGCLFTVATEKSGLYWCEGVQGRSNAVSITVSYGDIILKSPASPVDEGDKVDIYCQYRIGNNRGARFFKNGAEITTSNSSISHGVITMTIMKVTQQDEGFYKCASQDRKMESPESFLSVRPNKGSSKWITVSCVVVFIFLIPLIVLIIHCYRYKMICTKSFWPLSKEEVPTVPLPATKQDVTEVQWDLSWMEMSNLLDKNLYPGT
ncbi:cell adhesion molecule CEACAM5-like isoform 2-T2 [Pholidichthys leucotaenia]